MKIILNWAGLVCLAIGIMSSLVDGGILHLRQLPPTVATNVLLLTVGLIAIDRATGPR